MASLRIWMSRAFITWIVLVATPSLCLAQAPPSPAAGLGLDPASVGTNTALVGPWEFTLDGRIGVRAGRLKVGEFPLEWWRGNAGHSCSVRGCSISVIAGPRNHERRGYSRRSRR